MDEWDGWTEWDGMDGDVMDGWAGLGWASWLDKWMGSEGRLDGQMDIQTDDGELIPTSQPAYAGNTKQVLLSFFNKMNTTKPKLTRRS